ncbi:unnamed protein product, partial [Mesorhabditis spiculigera]
MGGTAVSTTTPRLLILLLFFLSLVFSSSFSASPPLSCYICDSTLDYGCTETRVSRDHIAECGELTFDTYRRPPIGCLKMIDKDYHPYRIIRSCSYMGRVNAHGRRANNKLIDAATGHYRSELRA